MLTSGTLHEHNCYSVQRVRDTLIVAAMKFGLLCLVSIFAGALSSRNLNLAAGKAATEHTLSLLYNRYQMFDPSLYGVYLLRPFLTMTEATWDMLKYKFALKMLEGDKEFLVVFAGSSVTAGHDNFLNESYPQVYERRMRSPLEALGIEFKMHNIAMGGQGCFPQNLCYESQGGDDADIYSWEQSYFCKGGAEKMMAAMSAARSRNYGMFMDQASGALNFKSCKVYKDKTFNYKPLYSDEDWTPAAAGLPEWKPTYEDVVNERKIDTSHGGSSYFTKYTGSQSTGAWNSWSKCSLPNCSKPQNCQCSQYNIMEQWCGNLNFINTGMGKFHPTGGGARHHPSSGVHMLRGESIVWYHANILLDAIYMVERDIARGMKHSDQIKEYYRVLDSLRPPRAQFAADDKNTKGCATYHCGDSKLECYNDYRPRWNERLSLINQVVNMGNWTWNNNTLNSWQLNGGYLDTPASLKARAGEGISLKVKVAAHPEIMFVSNKPSQLQNCTFYLDANVPPSRLQRYIRPSKLAPLPRPSASKAYVLIKGLPFGDHVLTITDCVSSTSLTHMMTWLSEEDYYAKKDLAATK